MPFPSDRRKSRDGWESAYVAMKAGVRAPMAAWLRGHLFDHVMPFWERHAIDDAGGILTCIDDSGSVLSTEKWLWSQWRAVWVFSHIHNQLDRDPRWLGYARQIADFCLAHGWQEHEEGWALLLSREGKVLRGCESTYVDAFAVYGLTELFRATHDKELLKVARRTADAALCKLSCPRDRMPHFPYPIPAGAKPHGIPMLWSLALAELAEAAGDERYREASAELSAEIRRDFYRGDLDVMVEWTNPAGGVFPGLEGSAVVPGHVIEDMWFQIHAARLRGEMSAGHEIELHLILRHFTLGWDAKDGGGLRLAVDARGGEEVGWKFADTKLWWPQTEALYATLLGWELTGRRDFLECHAKTWRLCLDHYVDWENGEWRQKLDRNLQPLGGVIALPVKDPFHLPRSLILQTELLENKRGGKI